MESIAMTLSSLPLCYCTNVHPGRSLQEVLHGLDHYTIPIRDRDTEPLAAGLWLAEPIIQQLLASENGIGEFAGGLAERGLTCHTLNAFPFGDFHSERVKENVYLPDWADRRRLDYTLNCAAVLARLPAIDGAEGSISTVPLAFKEFERPDDFLERAIAQLIDTAVGLQRLCEQTGRTIRLAIEPEPCCLLETTAETIEFFSRLHDRAAAAGQEQSVREHIGVCYDVCHQSVEFEDVAASIEQLAAAEIRINKVHISCAIQLDHPAENDEGRRALARYVEPRYLHQTFAKRADGGVSRVVDLTESFTSAPPEEFRTAETWRIHFHVPVDAEELGPLRTTRPDLRRALTAVKQLDYAPHLEVETYTWEVLPDGSGSDLVAGMGRELAATRELIAGL